MYFTALLCASNKYCEEKGETFSHDKWYMFQQQPPSLGHDVVSNAGISTNLASFLLVFMFCQSLGIVPEQASFFKY